MRRRPAMLRVKQALTHLSQADPVMEALIRAHGPLRLSTRPPDFATLARCIIGQQLSGKAAETIYTRLENAMPRKAVTPGGILRLDPPALRALGLSGQKTAYLRDLADRAQRRQIVFPRLAEMADEAVIETLTAVKGVGVWTAHMFLIFALRRPDVLPTGDLGIRNAIHRQYGLPAPPAPAEMERIAQPWRPYCSAACWYLWRSLDNVAAI
jgi:DNA-3-methyladenine glycosylase II